MNENSMTKKMLNTLRKSRVEQARKAAEQFVTEEKENNNFLTQAKILMEEAVEDSKKKILNEEENINDTHDESFTISKNTPQFGDVRTSQEDAVRKTINNNVQFEDDALKYYPKADDMTLDGKIPSLNAKFQFRFNDPSNMGCYLWSTALQLTDENVRTIGKIYDAFSNWKESIIQDGDLMEKLKKASENKD